MLIAPDTDPADYVLLHEAARLLGISSRHLWDLIVAGRVVMLRPTKVLGRWKLHKPSIMEAYRRGQWGKPTG